MPRGRPKGSGKQIKAIPTQYDHSETVKEMATELIKNYHSHLVNSNIAYLFVNKEITQKGRKTIATAEKCSKKVKAISAYDFVIVVSYPAWQELTDKQRLAVLDHELTHCLVDENEEGDTVYKILPHDFEEFGSILERHQLYLDDLKILGRIIEKLPEKEEELGVDG